MKKKINYEIYTAATHPPKLVPARLTRLHESKEGPWSSGYQRTQAEPRPIIVSNLITDSLNKNTNKAN